MALQLGGLEKNAWPISRGMEGLGPVLVRWGTRFVATMLLSDNEFPANRLFDLRQVSRAAEPAIISSAERSSERTRPAERAVVAGIRASHNLRRAQMSSRP